MIESEQWIERAQRGDREAMGELAASVKDLVYNLAIRMLGNPADAEDATQEILLRVLNNLGSFRGDSAFRTWVYRVASNQLLNTRARGAEGRFESFEALDAQLESNLGDGLPALEDAMTLKEAKLICTSAMLLCLDREHRLAFILGEILELESSEAAAVLEIAPEAFRKRLSRARTRVANFMENRCGLVNPALPCRCGKQAAHAKQAGYLDREKLVWATHAVKREAQQARVEEVDSITRAVAVFRGNPEFVAPEAVISGLRQILQLGGRLVE